MSSISSAVQLLTSQSLLPSNASGVAQKATPAQLSAMAVSNAGLQEAETLFASPSTTSGTGTGTSDYYTSSAGSDSADSVSLSNALLQSLTPSTSTSSAASKASSPAASGISVLA